MGKGSAGSNRGATTVALRRDWVVLRHAAEDLAALRERSHRIDAEEFYRMLKGVVVDDSKLFTTKLQEWEDFYNFDRPHGGLGGQTPYERLRQKTQNAETSDVSGQRQSHTADASVQESA
jgi:transposase InsO family protein